ncbi:lysM and putative peptidoglycan-binding domain-containing protein 2 isoform X1 [Panthera pardus]|uniref:LysM and putative peptidoglycan-binding domain-containing protein 2 n=1 Tax=Panthera pardus TaxID=9691 RepID=A0A9V1F868_PANPR|nr:lysM and putative peptidoglycan-binding domain-containing protein 2 isoform X1 [Panthera pardus]
MAVKVRPGKVGRAGGGARHARTAAPRRGLQPATPAERPAAAPVRPRKRRQRRRHRPLGELRDLAASAGPMADSSPALSLREGGPRAPRPSAPSPPARSRSGSESEEAELSLSLARTKTRSYGSTASVRAPLGAGVIERHVEHRVRAGDTLQGIALKYGVTMEQIKRANKLFTNDCIFLKKTLNIPVISEKPLLFNGLNSIDSPENETVDSSFSHEEEPAAAGEDLSPSSPQESDVQPVQPEEVSARDFLQRLDLQIKLSTQAAKKLKEESRDEESPYAASLYHS